MYGAGLSMRGDIYEGGLYTEDVCMGCKGGDYVWRGAIYEGDYTRRLYAWSAREGTMYGAGLSMRGGYL